MVCFGVGAGANVLTELAVSKISSVGPQKVFAGVSIKAGYWQSTATYRTSFLHLFGFH